MVYFSTIRYEAVLTRSCRNLPKNKKSTDKLSVLVNMEFPSPADYSTDISYLVNPTAFA
ncbi:hypothetical protein SAMN04487895_113102 [Paenibacillus sophorae]|uniref:Uncharacterized protein n=1 Tax=Paenibacillus sophorae TaxID=1333845 RepID=A0A1H8T9R2_9BACL|nr:hypothetical protein SAMN04487895_113102 [Paenibacillus sophorae]